MPFQSASRHINRKHCKCCIHQGLVICMLNRPFWPSAIGYIPSTQIFGIHVYTFYFRLDGTTIDDESLIDLGKSLSSNSTFMDLRCVAIFSYTQNSMKACCQFLCDPSLLKGYGIFFQGGGHIKLRLKLRVVLQIFVLANALMEPLMTKLIIATKMSSCCQENLIQRLSNQT